eukprot:7475764-Pyramimonas_sp.AAC.1
MVLAAPKPPPTGIPAAMPEQAPSVTSAPCKFFQKGVCRFGVDCRYSHDAISPFSLDSGMGLVGRDPAFVPPSAPPAQYGPFNPIVLPPGFPPPPPPVPGLGQPFLAWVYPHPV